MFQNLWILYFLPLPHLHTQKAEDESSIVDCSLYVKDTGTVKGSSRFVYEKSHKTHCAAYVSSLNI